MISQNGIDFLKCILKPEANRATLEDLRKHIWLKNSPIFLSSGVANVGNITPPSTLSIVEEQPFTTKVRLLDLEQEKKEQEIELDIPFPENNFFDCEEDNAEYIFEDRLSFGKKKKKGVLFLLLLFRNHF